MIFTEQMAALGSIGFWATFLIVARFLFPGRSREQIEQDADTEVTRRLSERK